MNTSLKSFLRRWHSLLLPFPLANVHRLPAFLADRRKFQAMSGSDRLHWADSYLCLGDATATTAIDPHYFYQSAWLARRLAERRPVHHTDVGSSVQMLGVISGFVPITFVDIRPIKVAASKLRMPDGEHYCFAVYGPEHRFSVMPACHRAYRSWPVWRSDRPRREPDRSQGACARSRSAGPLIFINACWPGTGVFQRPSDFRPKYCREDACASLAFVVCVG